MKKGGSCKSMGDATFVWMKSVGKGYKEPIKTDSGEYCGPDQKCSSMMKPGKGFRRKS